MKRLLAYLSILISVVLSVVIIAKPAVQDINGGYDYEGAREYVYQIVNHGETIEDFDTEQFESNEEVTTIAEEFEKRLISYDVEKYNIVTEGNDKIRVRFSAKNDDEYKNISDYLSADGNLSLVTFDGEAVFNNFDDELTDDPVMFGEKEAYITYKDNVYPGVVIPLIDAAQFNEKAVKHAEEINVPTEDKPVSQEGNIYLWERYDRNSDNFNNAQNNPNIQDKLILPFQYNNIWFEEKEEDYSSIVFYFNVEGVDENTTLETIPWNNVQKAADLANYYCHLINASHYEQRVYLLSEEKIVTGDLESLKVLGDTSILPAASNTLIATVVAFACITLIAIYFFKVNGLTTSLTAALGGLVTLFVFNALGGTLTFPAVLGFIITTALIYLSGISYSLKIGNEVAKGKTTKKAFFDGTRKAAWIIIDLSVIALIAGVFMFLLGNTYIAGCGTMLFFGGIINLGIQFIVNASSLYFLATSDSGMKKPSLFTNKKIEEPTAEVAEPVVVEEKDSKVEEETVTKKKTPLVTGIILGVLTLACTIGLIVFSAVPGATPYEELDTITHNDYAYVYVKKNVDGTTYNDTTKIKNTLNTVKYGYEENGELKFEDVYTDVKSDEYSNYTNPDASANSIQFNYYIYSVALNGEIDLTSADSFYVGETDDNGVFTYTYNASLSECLTKAFNDETVKFTINLVNKDFDLTKTYNLGTIALVTYLTIAVTGIYFLVRYGHYIAIMGVSISSALTAITLGLFSLLRVAVFNYISYAAIPVAIFSLFIFAFLSCKYKEEINENKVKVVDLAFKRKIAISSTDTIKNYAAIVGGVIAIITLSYFGLSAPATANTFLLTLGIIIFAYLVIALIYNAFLVRLYDKLGTIQIKKKGPKSRKKRLKEQHKARQRGKEVEEATFIGIND